MTHEFEFNMFRWCEVLSRLGMWWWREDIIRGLNAKRSRDRRARDRKR
jgi:hypothetical protein